MNNTTEHIRKEQWKDDVLSSVEGVQRAEAPLFLFTRIRAHIRGENVNTSTMVKKNIRVALPTLVCSIAAFAVLCCVNVWVLADFNGVTSPKTNVQPLQAASTLETINFDLY